MHVKYAFLHCSYSAPVRVSVITDDVWSIVARATVVALRAIGVDDCAVRVVVAARETVALLLDRGAITELDLALRAEFAGVPLRLATVFVAPEFRAATFCVLLRADDARSVVGFVVLMRICVGAAFCLLVAFPSRTPAAAVPMHSIVKQTKERIFFISD